MVVIETPSKLKKISNGAFKGSVMKNITIPQHTEVANYVFPDGCQMIRQN